MDVGTQQEVINALRSTADLIQHIAEDHARRIDQLASVMAKLGERVETLERGLTAVSTSLRSAGVAAAPKHKGELVPFS